jgi:hypothetical protein
MTTGKAATELVVQVVARLHQTLGQTVIYATNMQDLRPGNLGEKRK